MLGATSKLPGVVVPHRLATVVSVLGALAIACGSPRPGAPGDARDAGPDAGERIRREWPPPGTIGASRPARVVVPSSYDAIAPLPVVVLLGGYDHFARDLDEWLGMSALVDERAFILVLPDGTVDSEGSPFWNATDTCCDYGGTGVDDVAYLRGLLDELKRRFAVDELRLAIAGHSNGGFMAYRLACELPETLAAIASVAGSTWRDEADCPATRPVSILQVHGLEDDVMPFAGDEDAPGARETLSRWARRAQCDPARWSEEPGAREYADDGLAGETTVARYGGCASGVDVELWSMRGNDHYPEFRDSFARDVVAWLLAHPRVGP